MIHCLLESYFVEECNPMRRFDFSYYRRQSRSSVHVIRRLAAYILNRMIHCLLEGYFVEECSPMKRFDFSYYRRPWAYDSEASNVHWRKLLFKNGACFVLWFNPKVETEVRAAILSMWLFEFKKRGCMRSFHFTTTDVNPAEVFYAVWRLATYMLKTRALAEWS